MTVTLSIVGKSGSGKTTLMTRILPLLQQKGFRVGIIKHTAHGFSMDHEGKDSWKYQQAGADAVMVASETAYALVKKVTPVCLEELEGQMKDVDLILTEGYKGSDRPKIEVNRAATGKKNLTGLTQLVARITDTPQEDGLPTLHPDDAQGVADFIAKTFL
ncbi:molybdopterin-guanine dinucleotide biosynthesis protein B [Desulfoluna sp.]|uniref:molybdopterin-guanine dinucleotide biosynthesis protein B n=1 Tax=Desulfoluna sp. TaxID=2045199 RepID=UPI002628018E|nr:molybdopterin-guanine dinucleotide biosynthesis protein B [Desulfoluna sp.]